MSIATPATMAARPGDGVSSATSATMSERMVATKPGRRPPYREATALAARNIGAVTSGRVRRIAAARTAAPATALTAAVEDRSAAVTGVAPRARPPGLRPAVE